MSDGLVLAHLGGDALDQWERVLRWHDRLAPTRTDPPDVEPARSYRLDDLWAFFTACYHRSDWVVRAGVKTHQEVTDFIESSKAMRICRDIANGTKHYRLDPARKTTAHAGWTTTTVYTYESRETAHWLFVANGEYIDLFVIADACLKAWQTFLDVGPGKRNPWGFRIRLP